MGQHVSISACQLFPADPFLLSAFCFPFFSWGGIRTYPNPTKPIRAFPAFTFFSTTERGAERGCPSRSARDGQMRAGLHSASLSNRTCCGWDSRAPVCSYWLDVPGQSASPPVDFLIDGSRTISYQIR